MKNNNIFKKIINHEISSNIIYQDNLITAFYDINPKAPVHILLVPNIEISTMNEINNKHKNILTRLMTVAVKIAIKKKINKSGYRLVINCNKHGCQDVYHLHIHLLGGKPLGPFCT
ncbi:MAG: purine nucleoside phosphoramidase [Candidatus Westeberhardia cardiocondylae]|nr:purine nucleoside phosphoramidase [Candidatus Westeberhardia cardiocondylae]